MKFIARLVEDMSVFFYGGNEQTRTHGILL